MEFDPTFQGPQHHLSYLPRTLFPSNFTFNPHTQPMFPSQGSILIPSSTPPIMINVPTHPNPTFVMEGPLLSTPFEGGSSLGGFVNVHPMMLAPQNNINNNNMMMDALHVNHYIGRTIWDFSQNTMVHPFEASSSMSPPSSHSLSSEDGFMMNEYPLNTNQRMQEQEVRSVKEEMMNTNTANENIIKGQWTPEEDSALETLVNKFGVKKWSQIANLMHARIGKQCRERWNNHLKPGIKKGNWTLEEDIILIQAHQELGNKWSEIAKRLPGRPENSVKNHWNGTKRRRSCLSHNKNKRTPYEGAMLHAYIKKITAAKEAAKLLKKSIGKKNKKLLKCGCDELALLLGYAHCSHGVFNGNNNGYVPMQVNNNNVDGGDIGYGAMPMMKGQMPQAAGPKY